MRAPVASLVVAVDPGATEPLHQQLYLGLRSAILDRRLPPGSRVPSSRALAVDLRLSRGTVVAAMGQLASEGYLVTERGSGTRVAGEVPDRLMRPARADRSRAGTPGARSTKRGLSKRGTTMASARAGAPRLGPGPRAFRLGTPALDQFPVTLWTRLIARRARRLSHAQLDYGDARGYRALREAIADHVATSRGVRCESEQIIVVGGAQQGIDLAARLLLDAGDAAWLEEPGYLGARAAFLAAGARVVPVPVDGEGIDVEAGIDRAPDARLVYVSPSHQYPLGATMSLGRRAALLRWAAAAGAWVIEDDYDSEFRYAGRPLTALRGLDDAERVIYAGTFSKTLFPALRIGFLVVPSDLVDAFMATRSVGDHHPSALEQAVLADFIAGGHFARHLRRMRACYAERRDALVRALTHRGHALWGEPAGAGMHLVTRLPRRANEEDVRQRAASLGVECTPLSLYYAAGVSPEPGLVLGYACVTPREIGDAVAVLSRAIDSRARRR